MKTKRRTLRQHLADSIRDTLRPELERILYRFQREAFEAGYLNAERVWAPDDIGMGPSTLDKRDRAFRRWYAVKRATERQSREQRRSER